MRIDFAGERVLAVVAHPDDAELLCAGTLARAKADGAVVGVLVLCRGDKGQPNPPLDDLAAEREREMSTSSALLGADLLLGGYSDGELFDDVPARRVVIERFRIFRPTLVLGHSTSDYHPDHRAAGALAESAAWFAASTGWTTESPRLERPPALWWMDTVTGAGFEPAIYVDVSAELELKRLMLRCHATQMARRADGAFAPLEELLVARARQRGLECGVSAAEAFRPAAVWKRVAGF